MRYGTFPGWANLTGVALLVIMACMFSTSMDCVRRGGHFNLFYYVHLSYVAFFVLLFLHAPNFVYTAPIVIGFMLMSAIIYLIYGYQKPEVRRADILPCNTIRLELKKTPELQYNPGDWIHLNIPEIAKFEWHAFTISSSPTEPEYLTLHIAVVGSWTESLMKLILRRQREIESFVAEESLLRCYIRGPYAAPASNCFEFGGKIP